MKSKIAVAVVVVILVASAIFLFRRPTPESNTEALTVALSPFQDLAMLVNAEPQGFASKHGVKLNLVTMAWEDIVPAVASAGATVDVGFASLTEYLTKYPALNAGNSDPIVFFQPLYVYNGGGFVALDANVGALDAAGVKNKDQVTEFLARRIGAQKQSLYEMMIYVLASRNGLPAEHLKLFDTPMNDGILALESKSLDVSSAGLTQVNEAKKRGGRLVLSMTDMGFADVTGFICKRSLLEKRRGAIEGLVRAWFESVDFVMADINNNSAASLDYLRGRASTQYTLEQYTAALSQEYLPKSLSELSTNLLEPGSKYEFSRISGEIGAYLVTSKRAETLPPVPVPLVTSDRKTGGGN